MTYSFTNQTWTGFSFTPPAPAPYLYGTLTGASINVTLNASTSYTYADDFCLYISNSPLFGDGVLQCGGYSNLQASQRYFWPNGGSSEPGTTSIGTVNFTTGINMMNPCTPLVWIGNGYGSANTSGTWTGSITLHGVTAGICPAPGALALLGLAGLAGRRRR